MKNSDLCFQDHARVEVPNILEVGNTHLDDRGSSIDQVRGLIDATILLKVMSSLFTQQTTS